MLDEIENSFWDIIEELDAKISSEERIIEERTEKKQLIDLKKINQLKNKKLSILNVRELFHSVYEN